MREYEQKVVMLDSTIALTTTLQNYLALGYSIFSITYLANITKVLIVYYEPKP